MPLIDESEKLQCTACCKRIDNVFLLHYTESECSNINLDIGCVFRKPTVKYQRHDHPLVYFEKIYLHDARCSICNLLCDENLFQCYACDFNIHPECLLKPLQIIFDVHERITEVVEASSPKFLEENLAASLSKLMLRD
ncbi:hypothetical protein FEM48_Zijuj07G0045300 [Ziziphus jujuba var. spinosa]|uniref:DC1 domain-containing protein n=1 Tax=Ziziphus jujuba var. spinosa TaxID=714518 RepID=A0A978V2G6_ZIZJJ|nr:hypothetical protein FEM48_Zijuj07G0045300 [Ziziphus jujuba var. spinosa]